MNDFIPLGAFIDRFKPPPPPPPPVEADPKGKGKAVDQGIQGEESTSNLLMEVPECLDDWMSSAKIDKLLEIVEQAMAKGEKVVVFSQFTTLLALIETPLSERRVRYLRVIYPFIASYPFTFFFVQCAHYLARLNSN